MINRQPHSSPLKLGAISGAVSGTLLGAITLLSPAPSAAQEVDAPTGSQVVTIEFDGVVGDAPFSCNETYRLGTQSTAFAPLDFRLYVSNITLTSATGNTVPLELEQDEQWQYQNVALLDFEDKTGTCANGTSQTRNQVMGVVPAGDYTGVQFTVGVPSELNHIDATLAPSPLNLTSLWWNWNAGYKFARIDFQQTTDTASTPSINNTLTSNALKGEDGQTDEHGHGNGHAHSNEHGEGAHGEHGTHGNHGGAHGHGAHGDAAQAFAFHLGSVGCQMEDGQTPVSCALPHRAEVVLSDFNPSQNVVTVDLAQLFADTDMSHNQAGTAAGCMSNPADMDCQGPLQNLGLPFGELPAGEQTVFSFQ